MYIKRKSVDYEARFCVLLLAILLVIVFFGTKQEINELKQNNNTV